MDNQKIENLLNLSLNTPIEDRMRSTDLETGYDVKTKTWQVIVKYNGEVSKLQMQFPEIKVTLLSNQYAILDVPENQIQAVADSPIVIYMEKPKSLYLNTFQARKASCITTVQDSGIGAVNLTGKGTIVGVIDSGIDYSHPDFRNADGSTRILELWDQTINPKTLNTQEDAMSPEGYQFGTLFSSKVINEALEQTTKAEQEKICPSKDLSGHGTHVTGIAAGNGSASDGVYRGVAYEAELLIVKLGTADPKGFPNTIELMEAIDFCVKRAAFYGKPLALNLSFGNNYGSHSGSSLIETFLNDVIGSSQNCICIGTGNEGAAGGHTQGILSNPGQSVAEGLDRTTYGGDVQNVEFSISGYQTSLNLQIWKNYVDEFRISILSPSANQPVILDTVPGSKQYQIGTTKLLVFYGEPSPYSPYQEIYLDFLPSGDTILNPYLEEGVWTITLTAQNIVQGIWDMWMPSAAVRNVTTRFLQPSTEHTLTIPSTTFKGITVAAYDSTYRTLASFSGRGYTWNTDFVKPDLAAPGVDIISCAPGGGYTAKTGTSMATPFVTGSCALLMQYGIVDGKDPFLYGEKVKAYFIRGAKSIPVEKEYPNPRIGWGVLCVKDSLPG